MNRNLIGNKGNNLITLTISTCLRRFVFVVKQIRSWDLFDKLLHEANVVDTPGSGFGPSGEGYFRFSSFASHENVIEAMERIRSLKW